MRKTVFYMAFGCICLLLPVFGLAQSFSKFGYKLNDIAYNPNTDRIYGAYSGIYQGGNSILIIHPQTGVIEATIPVRAEPYLVRFSADFQYLYIGFFNWNGLGRYKISSGQFEEVIDYKYTTNLFNQPKKYVRYIKDFQLIPGQPDAVIVHHHDGYVRVYDNHVMRPDTVTVYDPDEQHIIYHPASGHLYAYNKIGLETGLSKYTVSASGIQLDSIYYFDIDEPLELEIVGDRLYCQSGEVFDISGPDPMLIGNAYVDNGRAFYKGALEYDPLEDIIYNADFIHTPFGYHLFKINATDFSLISQLLIPNYGINFPYKMIHTGMAGRMAWIAPNSTDYAIPLHGNLVLMTNCIEGTLANIVISTAAGNSVCMGDTVTLTASGNYDHYVWTNGMTGAQIKPVIDANLTITASAYDVNGCRTGVSAPKIFAAVTPASLTSAEMFYTICKGDSVTMTASSNNADYYIWSTGQQNISIKVGAPGYYTVLAYKGPGCTDGISKGRRVNWFTDVDIPKPVIVPSGPFDLCAGEQVILNTHSDVYTYQWKHNNSESDLAYVNESGDFQVRFKNPYGCYGPYSDVVSVAYHPTPPVPALIKKDSLLYSTSTYVLEWILNNHSIPAPANDSLIATGTGFYSIRSLSPEGCYSKWGPGVQVISDPKTIKGQAFIDFNKNDILDGDDVPFAHQRVGVDPVFVNTYTDGDGRFTLSLTDDTYKMFLRPDTSLWEVRLGKDGIPFTVPGIDSGYVFSVTPKADVTRFDCRIWHGWTRCFNKIPVDLMVRNTGTTILSGQLCYYVDDRITAVFENGQEILPIPDSLCWDIDSLYPTLDWKHRIEVTMPAWNGLNTQVVFKTKVTTNDGLTGGIERSSYVSCSFDPNDKTVFPKRGPEGQYALLGDTIEYTIRFQNTGNDTAFLVVIEDELSGDLLWESFTPLGASHDYTVLFDTKTGKLQIRFDPIMLPDSNVNLIGSQGYFSFFILPKPSLIENTSVYNEANIFFDLNPAVVTNNVEVKLVSEIPTSTKDIDNFEFDAEIIPNPYHDEFNISFSELETDMKFSVIDVMGRRWYATPLQKGDTGMNIDTHTWPSGVYLWQVVSMRAPHETESGVMVKE